MQSNKNSNPKGISLTSLLAQSNETDLSLDKKESLARLLIKVLLPKECHLYKNRPFELTKDFCHIYLICLSIKEKSDEEYKKIHRVFLRCKENKWDKVSFFNISEAISIILSANYDLPEHLKKHLQLLYELSACLDYLSIRYPYLLNAIFMKTCDETLYKKNIFLSFSFSDKKEFFHEHKIDFNEKKIRALVKNPYISKK